MASWLIRVSDPPPPSGIRSPIPPRITQRPAKLFQKLTFGIRAVLPSSGWLPVGTSTAISDVSEKSFVSYSKTRGVNDISPNVVWLLNVGCPVGLMMGSPLEALLRTTNGTLGERQDLISLLLGDSRFDGDVILRQGRRSFQSGFVLLHLLGGDSNAIGILAMEAFHDRVPALPGHS